MIFKLSAIVVILLSLVGCGFNFDEDNAKQNKNQDVAFTTTQKESETSSYQDSINYLLEEEGGDEKHKQHVEKVIAEFDKNDDKALDAEELLALFKEMKDKKRSHKGHHKGMMCGKGKKLGHFKHKHHDYEEKEKEEDQCLDLDGDGEITVEEIKKVKETDEGLKAFKKETVN